MCMCVCLCLCVFVFVCVVCVCKCVCVGEEGRAVLVYSKVCVYVNAQKEVHFLN